MIDAQDALVCLFVAWPVPALAGGVVGRIGPGGRVCILLNTVLLASFVWVELLGVRDLRLGWLAVGLLWSGSLLFSLGAAARGPRPVSRTVEGLFRKALNEYLLGNWFEVESTLAALLRQCCATSRAGCCWPRCCGGPVGTTRLWPTCPNWKD